MEILQVVLVFIVIVNFSESCKPYNECKIIHDCPRMTQLLRNRNAEDLEFVRKSNCGYVGKEPMVCCPKLPCWTPDRTEGHCMSIHDCPAIKSSSQSYASTTFTKMFKTVNYILNSRSRFTDDMVQLLGPHSRFYSRCSEIENGVCCPFPSRPTQLELKPQNQNQDCRANELPPDPKSNCCGVDPEVGHRISRGAPTKSHQYTWLAILKYKENHSCAGSLISGLYVLTAAHCVSDPRPLSVLLGVNDIKKYERDCKKINDEGESCMESQQISINNIILHPEFTIKRGAPYPNDIALLQLSNMANFNGGVETVQAFDKLQSIILHPEFTIKRGAPYPNDIALLQLSNMANFNEFIRPICLPSLPNVAVRFGQDSKLISAGWGATETQGGGSDIKMAVELPFLETNKCATKLNMELGAKHICTGTRQGEGPCQGDSGGPLMHQTEGRFEAVGVHSLGYVECGLNKWPQVFTNVIHYVPWINKTIKIENHLRFLL